MEKARQAVRAILKARSIVVSGHINPDGDAIGSLLSLGLGIEKLGKKVCMISRDGVPKRYRPLAGAGRIVRRTNKDFDLAIAVDCNSSEMLGKTLEIFKKAKNILEIDHHEFRRPFGTIALIDHQAAAVGELVYLLLKKLKIDITEDIAQNILASLIVETNSFNLPNLRPLTFEISAELLKKGVLYYKLTDMIYWRKTKESLILSKTCLLRSVFLKKRALVWSILRRRDFAKVKGREEDVDAVADEMRSIREVKIAVLFRERNKKRLRVSLRSKGPINIAAIAEMYGGGGHFDVAGCSIPNNKNKIKELLGNASRLLPGNKNS